MTDQPDYAKAEAFRQYVKACQLADYVDFRYRKKRYDTLNRVSRDAHVRNALMLVERYPDFPEAFRETYPGKASLAIGPSPSPDRSA